MAVRYSPFMEYGLPLCTFGFMVLSVPLVIVHSMISDEHQVSTLQYFCSGISFSCGTFFLALAFVPLHSIEAWEKYQQYLQKK